MSIDSERGSVSRPALSRCIGVTPVRFGDEFWGAAPLLTRAEELGRDFSDLFSAADVDELVSARAIRTPFVRMAKEGSVLPPTRYSSSGGFGAEIADQLSSEKVLEEFAAGSTLVLQALHRTWAPITEFTRRLAADLDRPCQVNAYVTPASSRGFDPHYDVHDVFVLQIHGEKRWMIHPPVHADPLGDQPWTEHRAAVVDRAAGTASIDETLRPGDALYLPRGWIHSATALGGTSIHLTVGIAALTRFDVVDQLVRQAAGDPRLRASLPLGINLSDETELRSIVQTTIEHLVDRLRHSGDLVESVGSALDRRLRRAIRPEAIRPLATIDALVSLDDSSRVSWRDGLTSSVAEGDSSVSIILPTKTVTLPIESVEAIRMLRSGAPATAGSLPGLDPTSSVVVTRRLVREGILVPR